MSIFLVLVGIALVAFGFYIDLLGLLFSIRTFRTGKGPSAVPLVPAILYVAGLAAFLNISGLFTKV
jgi:hypothetical protein